MNKHDTYLVGYAAGMLAAGLALTQMQAENAIKWFFIASVFSLIVAWWNP